MSSSLLLQQCLACLVRLTWIVFVMGGMWPYSWCLVGCCHTIKHIISNYNGNNATSNNPKPIKLFFHNQMHKHFTKLNKIALKNLICNDVSLTDSNNKIKLIIYSPKFNTTNFVISNNFSPSTSHLSTTNAEYKFKCLLGECFFNKIITYISMTTMTLSRYLTLHLSLFTNPFAWAGYDTKSIF